MAKILFLGMENLYVSALHGIFSESRKVIMYNVIETAKTSEAKVLYHETASCWTEYPCD